MTKDIKNYRDDVCNNYKNVCSNEKYDDDQGGKDLVDELEYNYSVDSSIVGDMIYLNNTENFEEDSDYCINCWRSRGDVKFYEKKNGYTWQYRQRCTLCERKYQQDFMEKYPKTKRVHKLSFLSAKEEITYEKIMRERFNLDA